MSLALVPDRWTLYTAATVCDRADVTYRQLHHWIELGLVEPSILRWGKGNTCEFDEDDIAWVTLVGDLVRLGVAPAAILEAVRGGREHYVEQMWDALERLSSTKPLVRGG